MKTIGRFFLLTAAVAMLFSCSATGFNIFGKAPVDTDSISGIIEEAGSSASGISESLTGIEGITFENGTITIPIEGEELPITITTGLNADDKIYGNDSTITKELAIALDGGNGAAVVEKLSEKELSDDDAALLKNTSKMYSSIISSVIGNTGDKDITDAVTEITNGFAALNNAENLTQADAVLVQSLTSVTFTLLESADTITNSGSNLTELLQLPEAESVVNDLGLIFTYSEALAGTESAASSLANSFSNLYSSLFSMIGGNAQ